MLVRVRVSVGGSPDASVGNLPRLPPALFVSGHQSNTGVPLLLLVLNKSSMTGPVRLSEWATLPLHSSTAEDLWK